MERNLPIEYALLREDLAKIDEDQWCEDPIEIDEDHDESSGKNKTDFSTAHAYTWSAGWGYYFKVISYTIQRRIKNICSDYLELEKGGSAEFQCDYNRHAEIMTSGKAAFTIGSKVFVYAVNGRRGTNSINSNHDITGLVEDLKKEIRENNPLRNRHIQIACEPHGGDFHCLYKKPPSVTFDDVILDDTLKEDIYDNTIFHMKNLKENNGIILHGDPGVGKSLICQAIIGDAIREGYSTCFVTTRVDYTQLNEFITNFLGQCIVIFEDIDSIGQSREHVPNSHLSDFLQFVSGLYEREDGVVFIATTNYIEHLDRAIANRPVRFNRKFKLELPADSDIRRLVSLYFKDARLEPALCYGKKFTGAHIKEIRRTAEMLSLKRGVPIAETYGDAVRLVERNFTVQTASPGF